MTTLNTTQITKAVVVLASLRLGLLFYQSGFRYFDPDEFQHLQNAWFISIGRVPYKDYFEHHLPLLHLLLAPIFGFLDVQYQFDHAVAALMLSRQIMLVGLILITLLTFFLARRLADAPTAAWAVLFMLNARFFGRVGIEIRPDIGAVVAFLGCFLCLAMATGSELAAIHRRLLFFMSGVLLATSILFTQKSVFILPGLAIAMMVYLWSPGEKTSRLPRLQDVLAQAVGFMVPLILVWSYFYLKGAGWELLHYNFLLNANWPSKLPLKDLLKNLIIHNPELVIGSLAGTSVMLWQWWRSPTAPLLILGLPAALLSLGLGLLIIPVAQQQYYFLALPCMGIIAAIGWTTCLRTLLGTPQAYQRSLLGLLLLVSVESAVEIKNVEIRITRGLDNSEQLRQLRYVIEQTAPNDTLMSGWHTQGLFRRNAYYYFFSLLRKICG